MNTFMQASAMVLISIIIGLMLKKQGQDIAIVLTVLTCCMVVYIAVSYLAPVMDFIYQLQSVGQLDAGMLEIVIKAVGIGLIGEVTGLICADTGNSALGKALQILSLAIILWLALPLMNRLLDLVQDILGEV